MFPFPRCCTKYCIYDCRGILYAFKLYYYFWVQWLTRYGKPKSSFKEKKNLYSDLLQLLHPNIDSETWNDNLCDLHWLFIQNNFQFDPTFEITCTLGSVHNCIMLYLEVCMCHLITYLDCTPIFHWCVVRWDQRINTWKNTHLKRLHYAFKFD